ncbi:hypothetical protein L1049_004812 [Liquidambar formosana]|uniref:Isopenicillin N synthase-like Fe(2+) 2OG dioxygenase domain-containing protein n=1 Tax=Liquidambar formosana TaxID=63359 RepID=A0AAP0WW20_LIQFO
MEKLISSWSSIQSVPESYILPPDSRPGKLVVSPCHSIPIIDLGGQVGHDRRTIMQQILKTSQEFGFNLNSSIDLPADDKATFYSDDRKKICRPYTSIDYVSEKVNFQRGGFGSYSGEVRKLSLWLLDLICEGLGLEPQYFGDGLSQVQFKAINHYPPCQDPSLTLRLPKHSDPNIITLLYSR